ncbi:hypothetical protein [Embleya sp. NPDC059237]|uniref:hypothetical protein n=1 Tax=Embleya sp. NPDC059237 TaxID=3346784 RepID=UPI00367739D0
MLLSVGAAVGPVHAARSGLALGYFSSDLFMDDTYPAESRPNYRFDLWLTSSGGPVDDVRLRFDTTGIEPYAMSGYPYPGQPDDPCTHDSGIHVCTVGTVDGYHELPSMMIVGSNRKTDARAVGRFSVQAETDDGRILVPKTWFTVSKAPDVPKAYQLKQPIGVRADSTVDPIAMFRVEDGIPGDLIVFLRAGPGARFRDRFTNCHYSRGGGSGSDREPEEALCVAEGPFTESTTYQPATPVVLDISAGVSSTWFDAAVGKFDGRTVTDWVTRHGDAEPGTEPALDFTEVAQLQGDRYASFDLYKPVWRVRTVIRPGAPINTAPSALPDASEKPKSAPELPQPPIDRSAAPKSAGDSGLSTTALTARWVTAVLLAVGIGVALVLRRRRNASAPDR